MSALSTRLRELRIQAGMSQEHMAQKLGFSVQAVSKWENDKSRPDISTLVPLANLFHVSVDDLLGNKKRRDDWEQAWHSSLSSGSKEEKLEVLKSALAEFPDDPEFKYRLACIEFFLAEDETDPEKRTRLLALSDEHFSSLRKQSPDFSSAASMHIRVLAALGRKGEAAALAKTLPDRERLLLSVLEGEALAQQKRKAAALSLLNLFADLTRIGTVKALEKAKILIAGVAGGEPQFFDLLLDAYYLQALRFCEEKDLDSAIDALKAEHQLVQAYENTETGDRETFFYPMTAAKTKDEIRELFQKHILDERFSCLRGTEEYKEFGG